MRRNLYITVIMLFFISITTASAQQDSASQILRATLGDLLTIDSVKVDNIPYHKNERFLNVDIKSVDKSNPDVYPLGLSPMVVKIGTNLTTPIYVNAEFLELKHAVASYQFPSADIFFSPSSYTINNPYDGVETGIFTPVATARLNTVIGQYEGKVLFTLGAI